MKRVYQGLHFWGRRNLLSSVLLLREVHMVPWAPEFEDGPVVCLCSLHLIIIVADVLHLQDQAQTTLLELISALYY